jgi:tRNA1(Val) A37 N6-methylase TrmN6
MRSRKTDAVAAETTDDAVLGGRLKLLQPAKGHRAGHDAILLAAAAPSSRHAVDLGAGVGTAGLALLARDIAARVTLVEIDPDLAALADENAKRNGFAGRAAVVAADALKLARKGGGAQPAALSADLVLMNPPFNDPARRNLSPLAARRRAHGASDSDLNLWVGAAERLLAANGMLVLIHRPEAVEAILASLEGRFGAAELIPVFPREGAAAIRLIVRARKGRRTPPAFLPGLVLNDADNRPTGAAERILREGAAL